MLGKLGYFAEKALGAMREAPGVSAVTTTTIGAALVVLAIFVVAFRTLEHVAREWGRIASVQVVLDDGLDAAGWEAARVRVAGIDGVKTATVVTPEAALERFKERGNEAQALVEGVSPTLLPATLDVELTGLTLDVTHVERLANTMRGIAGVAEVDYGREDYAQLSALVEVLRYGSLLAGLVIALATAFIVSNTIRLNVYARRGEIAILQLVGATGPFIRAPFLIEGGVWGVCGGALATAILVLAERGLGARLSHASWLEGLHFEVVTPALAGALVAGGLLLGVLGSALAVRRFMDAGSI